MVNTTFKDGTLKLVTTCKHIQLACDIRERSVWYSVVATTRELQLHGQPVDSWCVCARAVLEVDLDNELTGAKLIFILDRSKVCYPPHTEFRPKLPDIHRPHTP
eukprot:3759242-Amphidinium_carterae.1